MHSPFGSLAIPEGPMALRPTLADGLPLSGNPVKTDGRMDQFPFGSGRGAIRGPRGKPGKGASREKENRLAEARRSGRRRSVPIRFGPFGGLAIPEGPMALRASLADGLPL